MNRLFVLIAFLTFTSIDCFSQIKVEDRLKIESILKKSISIDNQYDGSFRIIIMVNFIKNNEDIKVIADSSIVNKLQIINDLKCFFKKKRYLRKYLTIIARYRFDGISNEESFIINLNVIDCNQNQTIPKTKPRNI